MSFTILSLTVLSLLQQVTSLALNSGNNGPVAAAWYTGGNAFPLSEISWAKYNTLFYSFAITTPDVNSLSLNGSNPSLLPEFVSEAHKNGVAAHIAIGGSDGGLWFSSNIATPENRTVFVKTITDFAKQYSLDGINFDWEFPNRKGLSCDTVNVNDTQNFLSFLQELRMNSIGANLTLSAAALDTPFNDASGKPSTDVSGFAKVLDYITIMNYEIWGPWSSAVGPNAPLNDTCAISTNQFGSAVSAVRAWNAAGIPVSQIVLGVPSYGHSFNVSPSNAFVTGSKTDLVAYPKFYNWTVGNDTGSVDACGVYQPPSTSGPTFSFRDLINGGFLTAEGNPAPGIYYRYDNCSQTPYVYNTTSHVMVSYDNAQSFTAKAKFINETNLRGFAMWETAGDYNDILLDTLPITVHSVSLGGSSRMSFSRPVLACMVIIWLCTLRIC